MAIDEQAITRNVRRTGRGRLNQPIVVGVDFSPESQVLVKFATHLDSRASMQLFDVIDTADEAMHAFIDLPQARTRQLLAAVGKGEAGGEMVKQQQRWDADLVVVGKTGSSAWTDWTPRQCCGKPMALW